MFIDRRNALKTLGLSAGATFLSPMMAKIEVQAAGKPISEALYFCG